MQRSDITYKSGKVYTHAQGLSCCFRQWRATSHCRYLHGYSLQVEVVFKGPLDDRNWVMDFGGLKLLKTFLEDTFDHKTLVAEDDPAIMELHSLHALGIIDRIVVDAVGAEKFAEMIYDYIDNQLFRLSSWPKGVVVESVKVSEHPGNFAIVERS